MSADSKNTPVSPVGGAETSLQVPAFHPAGTWTKSDFLINKHYWEKRGVGTAAEIRRKNLVEIRSHLQRAGIRNFLIGKTLRGLVRTGAFEEDNDDDFGIHVEDQARLLEHVAPLLIAKGFSLIRSNDEMISFERGFRYVDICLFRRASVEGVDKFGYANKWHDGVHFESLEVCSIFGETFDIPTDSENLLRKAYKSGTEPRGGADRKARRGARGGRPDRTRGANGGNSAAANRVPGKGGSEKAPRWRRGISSLMAQVRKSVRQMKTMPLRLAKGLAWIHGVLPVSASRLIDRISAKYGEDYEILTEGEFRDVMIEPQESYNWIWRKRHLDLVTGSGRHRTIGAIIGHLSEESVRDQIGRDLSETDTSIKVVEPINRDMDFWWGGNNYFWNCVKYGFRKGVIPYSEARQYIESGTRPLLYSGPYYEGLPAMTESEIRRLLLRHPIEITDGAVTSGKHRAFAMIGRMIAGDGYLPIRARIRSAGRKRGKGSF